ncbi:MAG: hypothetical protein ACOYI6_00245 [Christensenellales bacterium]|jgi:hypothetical protein|nr:hypothetical protein [Clostridiales bacterium]
MKKLLTLTVVLCLLFTNVAFAAPTRDVGTNVLENPDLVAQIQPLCNAAAAVAIKQDIRMFRNETTPEPVLVQGLLYEAVKNHLVVIENQEGMARMGLDEAKSTLKRLFYHKDLPVINQAEYPGLQLADGTLTFDVSNPGDFIGAHIYEFALDEEELLLRADIYRLSGIEALAVDAPEDSLTWLGHMGMRLKPDADSLTGFTLASFAVPERYTEAKMVQYVDKNRFEFQYPDFLTQREAAADELLLFTNADESVTLRVREYKGTLEDLLEESRKENAEQEGTWGGFIENNRLLYRFNSSFRIAYFDPQNGEDTCLVLEVTFPYLKEHEFSLYMTFLDNSFVVYSHSMG